MTMRGGEQYRSAFNTTAQRALYQDLVGIDLQVALDINIEPREHRQGRAHLQTLEASVPVYRVTPNKFLPDQSNLDPSTCHY